MARSAGRTYNATALTPERPMRRKIPHPLARAALLPLVGVAACMGRAAPRATDPACPPGSELPRLIRVTEAAPGIREDIRYATADNFTGAPLPGYETPAALLRPAAAEALARVQRRLEARGLGLLVWDAYRPVRATLAMVAWAERTGNGWVLEQGYVARRSNHNRGNTVDLTVVDLATGEPLDMGTAYDHFGIASHTANASGEVLRNRRTLLDAMAAEGWRNYPQEWWHFSLPGDHDFVDVPIGCFLPPTAVPGSSPGAAPHARAAPA